MNKTGKKLVLTMAACLAVACGGAALHSISYGESIEARADNTAMTVDVLGNLQWNEVSGATGYTWRYTVAGKTSAAYTAEDNQADVGIALTEAAQAAIAANNADGDTTNDTAASVQFSVTPIGVDGAETMVYTHSFTQYIDYGYATHDFGDIKAQAAGATKISELTLDGSLAGWISSAMYKNDVLTIGLRADTDLGENGVQFGLFGKYYIDETKLSVYNYRLMQKSDGSVALGITCNFGDAWYKEYAAGTNYNTALELEKEYYLAIAVFDTFDMTGNAVGETVYYSRSAYNSSEDELQKVGGFTEFIDNATLTSQKVGYKDSYKLKNQDSYKSMEVDRSGMHIYAKDASADTYVFSGVPTYTALAAPTGIYYDNTDGCLYWNKVKGATEYEWRFGNGEWTKTDARCISAETALEEYEALGYLPFGVRAVGGKTAEYRLDLTRFYNARSTVKDYIDLGKAGKKASGDEKKVVKWPTKISGSYGPANYYYNDTGLALGTHITFKFKVLASASYDTKISGLGIYGANGSVNYNRYFLNLYGDGTVQLGNAVTRWNTNVNDRPKSKYWRVINVADGFALGKTYYVTYGLDDVYEKDVKVAERFTVRIELEEDGGLSRRTIGLISCDNEQFATDGYAIGMNGTIQGDSTNTAVNWYRATDNAAQEIQFTANGKSVASKTTAYGDYYDFTDVATPAVPSGYSAFEGWTYVNSKGKEKFFPLEGTFNLPVSEPLEVKARFTPIEYSVTYDVPSDNAATYTTGDEGVLSAPAQTPAGKVFDAWYEESDTAFANPITSLSGKTGNLKLVARFVDKYTISVTTETGTQEYEYRAGGTDKMTLIAPAVQNKNFVGWQILSGGEYVDYTGNTTFVPTQSASFKAVYKNVYAVELHYGVGQSILLSKNEGETLAESEIPAVAEGYQFGGLYTDSTYETLYDATKGVSGDLNVYVKWVPVEIKVEEEIPEDDTPTVETPEEDQESADEDADTSTDDSSAQPEKGGNKALAAVLGSLGGVALGLGAAAVYFFIKKKKLGK